VDGDEMYSGGSVIGKASKTGIEILLTPPIVFIRGQKVKFEVVFNITQL